MSSHAVLLIAHGSRDEAAREEYLRIRQALADRLEQSTVEFAVLEFPDSGALPSIAEGWRRCVASGATDVVVLPFFLFPAGHVREDVPAELRDALRSTQGAALRLLPPLGPAEELLDVIVTRASEVLEGREGDGVAVLLVGAGTSDPDANGDLCKAARLLWERRLYKLVEVAWVSLTEPTVGQGLARCRALGATTVAVVPYFLNTGVLMKRVERRLEEALAAVPEVTARMGGHMGVHPRLIDLLERKVREGLEPIAGGAPSVAVCGRPSCMSVVSGQLSLSMK
ncbi:MAG: sirohydrochlorin chelatase [Chloroflexota bacterium]